MSDEIIFKNLSRRASVFLGFEVANHVLAHLTGCKVNEHSIDFNTHINFSVKECNIIMYLNGYVFGNLYRCIIRSKSGQNKFGTHSLSTLLAGKVC